MTLECEFWEAPDRACPVRDFLESVGRANVKAHAKLVRSIDLMEEKGLQFMMQNGFVDKFKYVDVYEIRVEFNKIQYRILGVLRGSIFYLLLGFIKKGQKTPTKYLETAVMRAQGISL